MTPSCQACGSIQLRQKDKKCANCRLDLLSRRLMEQNKLSAEAWQQFRIIVDIPSGISELPVKKARFALQLLEYFVAHSSLAQSDDIPANKLKAWLTETAWKAISSNHSKTPQKPKTDKEIFSDELGLIEPRSEKKKRNPVSAKLYISFSGICETYH